MVSKKIQIIKTLPHLIPLFISNEEVVAYSNIYSSDTLRFLKELEIVEKPKISFSYLTQYFSTKNTYSTTWQKVNKITQKLQFSIKGDTVSLWPIGYEHPIRIEFFGEDLEKIYLFDELYGRKIKDVENLILSTYIPEEVADYESINIINLDSNSNPNRYIFVNSLERISEAENIEFILTDFQYPQLFYSKFNILEKEIATLENNGYQILIKSKNAQDLPKGIKEYRIKKIDSKMLEFDNTAFKENINTKHLPAGLISEKLKLAVFTDRELFGAIYLTRPEKVKKVTSNLKRLLRQFEGNIQIGDYVVHEDYGVGIYSGLQQEMVDGEPLEYLLIKYADQDELFVPIHQIEKITKYIGSEGHEPKVTRLGRASWENLKTRIKKSAELLARDLIEHLAKREVSKAKPIHHEDSKDYKQFVEEFKYTETEDQLNSINEVIQDLEKDKPMNRLLVGDVGFGKTEVFMRAALKIVEGGGQVAVLAPTTILTAQHFAVFEERFKSFPFKIAYLSRFNTSEENKKIIDEINEGKVDIVIGTHRLLSSDVKFKNLQLIVIDEEQRFGVKQKEKIKQLNYGVHLLSVSATPIPRTLSMALSTIQDISIITQPPKARKSVHTEIITEDYNKIVNAINCEINRDGQVYFLHNEVHSIEQIKSKLSKLLPDVKFAVSHGQMRSDDLDRVMTEFYEHKFDVLICSTIVENGLDLPNVNTIIINKADRFGLSQLYQLRGRVGRSERNGFCYLIAPKKAELEEVQESTGKIAPRKYKERLQTLVENQDLGAGFRIASKDLEIRGAGNLLGEQQSGHISTVGYALYIQILAEEVEKLKTISQSI